MSESVRPLRLSYGLHPLQVGDLRIPRSEGPYPLVILIHGGFWRNRFDRSLMEPIGDDLCRRGIASWNIEYRRVGDAGGGWPGTLLDVAAAADAVRELAAPHNLDLRRVVTVGHSAGGHLALWLAARHRISRGDPLYTEHPLALAGAVSLAGVVDLKLGWEMNLSNSAVAGLLGGSYPEMPERYASASPAELLPLGIPQTLVHGDQDDSVPFAVSQAYESAARAAGDPVRLLYLPGADHFVVIDPSASVWLSIVNAITESFN